MSKLRKEDPIDYTVAALEGLWWTEEGELIFERKDQWRWTLMMMQPEHITDDMFQEAVRQLGRKKDNPSIARLRLERFHEGMCAQIMHIGPYSDEPHTIERLMAFVQDHDYRLRGKHHEIYLGDPRRSKPEKLRTVLRHPIAAQ